MIPAVCSSLQRAQLTLAKVTWPPPLNTRVRIPAVHLSPLLFRPALKSNLRHSLEDCKFRHNVVFDIPGALSGVMLEWIPIKSRDD